MVIAALLPLILPALGDPDTARRLALGMLAEYQPETLRELRLAGTIIGIDLNCLAAIVRSGEPDLTPERRAHAARSICTLNRSGLQALRQFAAMQRDRRANALPATVVPATSALANSAMAEATTANSAMAAAAMATSAMATAAVTNTAMANAALAEAGGLMPPPMPGEAAQPAPVGAAEPASAQVWGAEAPARPCVGPAAADGEMQPAEAEADAGAILATQADVVAATWGPLQAAEVAFSTASATLVVMESRYKGAPQPHTPAGQVIARQRRVVDAARMQLDQARRRHADATAARAQVAA